jgi:hypothetical protein
MSHRKKKSSANWILDFGFWILDFRFWIDSTDKHFGFTIEELLFINGCWLVVLCHLYLRKCQISNSQCPIPKIN